jgi:hypothetical protein
MKLVLILSTHIKLAKFLIFLSSLHNLIVTFEPKSTGASYRGISSSLLKRKKQSTIITYQKHKVAAHIQYEASQLTSGMYLYY